MEIETKNVEHFKKAGMVLSAKCWRERSSQIRTERYPLVFLTKRSEVTKRIWDLHGIMSRLVAKSKMETGAKAS